MKSKYNHIQVYNIWVNGRGKNDVDQHFPIDSTHERNWHNDFKQASEDYLNAQAVNVENNCYKDIFQDYHVALYSIDINIDGFEKMFDLDFDLDNEDVQNMIPYYVDYDFNTVAERIAQF